MKACVSRAPVGRVRVLIVDDSAMIRRMLRDGFEADGRFTVVGAARDPYEARELLVEHRPDVMTLDVEMPRMDGVTFLRHVMRRIPTPTVMVSSLTGEGKKVTLAALEAGAVDIVEKPRGIAGGGLKAVLEPLCDRVVAASRARVERHHGRPVARINASPHPASQALAETSDKVFAIGSSTGGVAALTSIIPRLPPAAPGVVIVQHMPPGFTASLAHRLDEASAVTVAEAQGGERVRPGLVLIAPGGDRHLRLIRRGGHYIVTLEAGEPISGHRPSVDALFASVAKVAGANAAGALLTGMGRDGADGLLEMRHAGARCFAQDEATSIVYGMPGAAVANGAAEAAVPLDRVIPVLLSSVTQRFSSF